MIITLLIKYCVVSIVHKLFLQNMAYTDRVQYMIL